MSCGFFSLAFYFHTAWTRPERRVVVPEPTSRSMFSSRPTTKRSTCCGRRFRAAVGMRYPHRTFVLDDGRRPAVRAMAEEVGALYADAQRQRTPKPATGTTPSRRPTPTSLQRSMPTTCRVPSSSSARLASSAIRRLRSSRHRSSTTTSIRCSTRSAGGNVRICGEQDAFFQLVMPGKDNWNAAFFCGTGARCCDGRRSSRSAAS